MIYVLTIILFLLGLYGVSVKKNLIKVILGFIIMDSAINLMLILIGYRHGGIAPILLKGKSVATFAHKAVDPLPQALVLTSIVIGLGVTALFVAIAIRIYDRYGTLDVTKIRNLRG